MHLGQRRTELLLQCPQAQPSAQNSLVRHRPHLEGATPWVAASAAGKGGGSRRSGESSDDRGGHGDGDQQRRVDQKQGGAGCKN
jgi:hypothetical protein